MVIALIFAQCRLFHPFFHTAVPSGSCTRSPSCAALIASQTASGVNAAAVRVSARTFLSGRPPPAKRKTNTNDTRNRALLIFIVLFEVVRFYGQVVHAPGQAPTSVHWGGM